MDPKEKDQFERYMKTHYQDYDSDQSITSSSSTSFLRFISSKVQNMMYKNIKEKDCDPLDQKQELVKIRLTNSLLTKYARPSDLQDRTLAIEELRKQRVKRIKDFQDLDHKDEIKPQKKAVIPVKINQNQQSAIKTKYESSNLNSKNQQSLISQKLNFNYPDVEMTDLSSSNNQQETVKPFNNDNNIVFTNDQNAQIAKISKQSGIQYKCDPETLPILINNYAQVLARVFILSIIIFLALTFIIQIKQDLSMKLQTENDILIIEINKCSQEYFENKCQPESRVRALEEYCTEKNKCMNRDPLTVNKNSKIMVKLLAEIINDFFEPLTYKAIALIVIVFALFIFFSECLANRSRTLSLSKKSKIQ